MNTPTFIIHFDADLIPTGEPLDVSKWVLIRNGDPVVIFSVEFTDVDALSITVVGDFELLDVSTIEYLGGDPLLQAPPGCLVAAFEPLAVTVV